ncbi:MAG: insulinase family protein [Clostridiales bacterium]|jgi:predicted Zn-dependent peptidase|nr:insulinase family protein [Clostridiales bacterium]
MFTLVNTFSGCAAHRHESGAILIHAGADNNIANSDAVFAAAFYTPALNDRGTAHVLEHCVLEGSRRYADSPFEQLNTNVIWSYLNALTYEDRTVYTFATPDEPSFNIMFDIYFDALFAPLLREETFEREREVVCNEMRGRQADQITNARLKAYRQLLAGTSYEFCNMGSPKCINILSLDECICYYERFYNPTNVIFYLYTPVGWDAPRWINALESKLSANGFRASKINGPEPQAPKIFSPVSGAVSVSSIDGATFVLLGQKTAPKNEFAGRALFEALSFRLECGDTYFDEMTPYLVMGFGADVKSIVNALSSITRSDILRAIDKINLRRVNNYARYKPQKLMLFLELLPWCMYG